MIYSDFDENFETYGYYDPNYFKKTTNEARKKGYNFSCGNTNNKASSQNTIDKLKSCIDYGCIIVTLGVVFYGAYKFYKHVYKPIKKAYDSCKKSNYVNKSKEKERILNGEIYKQYSTSSEGKLHNERFNQIFGNKSFDVKNGKIEDAEVINISH